MGDHCHVVLGQKLRNFKGPVSRGIVVVDNEVLVLPFLWPLRIDKTAGGLIRGYLPFQSSLKSARNVRMENTDRRSIQFLKGIEPNCRNLSLASRLTLRTPMPPFVKPRQEVWSLRLGHRQTDGPTIVSPLKALFI
jgi:hypothetical protein